MRSSTWPGLDVNLVIDGVAMQEHEDQEAENEHPFSNHKTVTRYVQAVSGANFSVDLHMQQHFPYKHHDIAVRLLLDGAVAKQPIIEKGKLQSRFTHKFKGIEKLINGQWQLNRFAFADLRTSDGAPKADLKEKLSRMGEVTVELSTVAVVGQAYAATGASYDTYTPAVTGAVPEKALKGRAISSHTTLSAPERSPGTTFISIDRPWGSEPFVTFKFLYRSPIEGIVPRSPSPTPVTPLEDRDPDSLTAEEARELVRRQREQLNGMTKVKREKREYSTVIEDDEDDDITVTDEQNRSSKRSRTFRDSAVEIIDLCDD